MKTSVYLPCHQTQLIGTLSCKNISGDVFQTVPVELVELPEYPEPNPGRIERAIIVGDGEGGHYIEKTASRRNGYLATIEDAVAQCERMWGDDRRYEFKAANEE